MTTMSKITPATIQKGALVALDRITLSDDFWFREDGINPAHKADLASTIRNTGRALDPILVWQPDADDPEKLTLLDGAHRIEAYRAADWPGEIPAMILVGADRRAALGAALKANSKRALGLSQAERMDAAWRLVREPVKPRFKVKEISFLADVAGRTVDYMRARFRTMHEENIKITGSWAMDRRAGMLGDDEAFGMDDAKRQAEIKKLAADMRDLVDRRKHPERAILRDSLAVWEAVHDALGAKAMKDMLAYLFGGDEDEADEWLQMAMAGPDPVQEGDDEQEPAF